MKASALTVLPIVFLMQSTAYGQRCPNVEELRGGRFLYTFNVMKGDAYQRLPNGRDLGGAEPSVSLSETYLVAMGNIRSDGRVRILHIEPLAAFAERRDWTSANSDFPWGGGMDDQETINKANTFKNCWRAQAGGSATTADTSTLDNVTPQVPGCPKYLRKSLVTWRQVGNPQLNTWEIRNRSDKTLKVTFREGGSNSSPDTLPPGQSTQVSLSANQVPSYVVRDFDELFTFNRANGTSGKTLQCDLAIRPR